MMAASPWPFGLLTLLLIAAAGWEWGRLNGLTGVAPGLFGGLITLCCALAWWSGWAAAAPPWAWWLSTACWVLGGSLALRGGPAAWPHLSRGLRLAVGALVLCATWLALAAAMARGLNFILSTCCLVWMADIAAYFGGRALGRRKLAPAISPGKSWEGVWSGMLGVIGLALVWRYLEADWAGHGQSLYDMLWQRLGAWGGVLALVFLSSLSVMGDLIESLAKRAVGAKDSSRLLPGHGGVLDRVDALLPVLPAVMAFSTL
jgi:phosphatidate cytidylyltransferase